MYDEDKLTLEDVRTLGAALWLWLALHPVTNGRLSFKKDWPEFYRGRYGSKKVYGYCFCCQYTEDRSTNCEQCPIDWTLLCSEAHKGAFYRWDKAEDTQQRAVWAYQVYLLHMGIVC